MEHLWINNMVGTDGELTKLGRFAADMEPMDPENAVGSIAVAWPPTQCSEGGDQVHIYDPNERKLHGKSQGKGSLPSS